MLIVYIYHKKGEWLSKGPCQAQFYDTRVEVVTESASYSLDLISVVSTAVDKKIILESKGTKLKIQVLK